MARRRDALLLAGLIAGVLGIAGCTASPPPAPTFPPQVETPPPAQPTATATPSPIPTDTPPPPTPTAATPQETNAQALIQSFIEAPFRAVAVAKSPLAPYTLIVATERATPECGSPEDPQRCTSDETCGSLYTSPTCYFFVEPSFHADADANTRYVSRWPDDPTLAGLETDSLRFIDARTVEFRASGGDGGYSLQETWWLDLVTGALALQSRVEQGG